MLLSKFPHIELEHNEQTRQDIEMNYVKHFPPPPLGNLEEIQVIEPYLAQKMLDLNSETTDLVKKNWIFVIFRSNLNGLL